jgi:hypothetical protein
MRVQESVEIVCKRVVHGALFAAKKQYVQVYFGGMA